jgi:hypothetical protein
MPLAFRALEIHGRRMWERARVIEALDFIKRHRMTALVLHETDLVHQVVFPRRYFDPYAQWKSAPTRRGENAIQNNRVYLDHLLQMARKASVEVWLEVKDIGFPDEVLEAHPELIKDGRVCPSEPFWYDFVEHKTAELFQDFPGIAGLIASVGSPESRTSRAQNKCSCKVCAATPLVDWYARLIEALHRPIAASGRRLAVRDFAYKPEDHAPLIEAVARAPEDVIFCIKATPHDFYPTFPDNPAIGRLSREQWLEYDAQGQFFGWGVFPCLVLDDLRERLQRGEAKGVNGGVFRTEWERVNDWWCLESPNVLNLIAAAALGHGEAVDPPALCRRWFEAQGWTSEAAEWLGGIMADTWPVIRRALYLDGHVFADCSMYPRSLGRAWWTMEHKHSLVAWAPERAGDLELDEARIDELLAEKQEARAGAAALLERLEAGHPALDAALRADLLERFALFVTWIEGFQHCAEVCLRARHLERDADADPRPLEQALARLEAFGERIRPLAEEARHPHHVVMLVDHRRVADIAADARTVLRAGRS